MFAAVQAAHQAIPDDRAITAVEIDEDRRRPQQMRQRVASVERAPGHPPYRYQQQTAQPPRSPPPQASPVPPAQHQGPSNLPTQYRFDGALGEYRLGEYALVASRAARPVDHQRRCRVKAPAVVYPVMELVSVDDVTVPALGLGTARMGGRTCERVVARALEAGYRHVDTAQMYGNEDAVGAGIAATDVDRDEVFVTTKLDRGNRSYDAVLSSTGASLDRLGLDTIDLLLMHSPNQRVPLSETISAMNELQSRGRVAHVGVSNFSVGELQSAIETSATPIVTNQVEYHPYHHQNDLLAFCNEADVILTAYSPLARGRVADDAVLGEIGDRYGKTAAQVTLRWLLQQPNVVAIPKAANEDHLRENVDVFDFTLTDEEVGRIFELDGGLAEKVRRHLS